MANPERGEVDLTTPTKTYTLEITTNATCAMEKRTGRTYGQLLNALVGLDVSALRSLAHAALQAHHAREFPTEDAVGKLIDVAKQHAVRSAMLELFTLNAPPADEASTNGSGTANPPEGGAAGGIGDNSTSTPAASG